MRTADDIAIPRIMVSQDFQLRPCARLVKNAPKSTRHRYGPQRRGSMLARGPGSIHLAGRKCAPYTMRSTCAAGTGLSRLGVVIWTAHVENEAGVLHEWTLLRGVVDHGCLCTPICLVPYLPTAGQSSRMLLQTCSPFLNPDFKG